MAIIFDGKKLAKEKEEKLTREVAKFKKKTGISPKLVAVMVEEDPATKLYLQVKEKAAKRVRVLFEKKKFPATAKPSAIVDFIKKANDDSSVHGIMMQLPLPKQYAIGDTQYEILGSIKLAKDVDCLTPENLGLLMIGRPLFLPATIKAVLEVIRHVFSRGCNRRQPPRLTRLTPQDNVRDSLGVGRVPHPVCNKFTHEDFDFLQGREVVVVGAGRVAGLPLAMHLKNLGATLAIGDEYTTNLTEYTKRAEILISATGVPGLIKKEMVKKGAVVIDVGSPKGDVDFEKVKKVASAITPVPGGVGPLTVISLLENVFLATQS